MMKKPFMLLSDSLYLLYYVLFVSLLPVLLYLASYTSSWPNLLSIQLIWSLLHTLIIYRILLNTSNWTGLFSHEDPCTSLAVPTPMSFHTAILTVQLLPSWFPNSTDDWKKNYLKNFRNKFSSSVSDTQCKVCRYCFGLQKDDYLENSPRISLHQATLRSSDGLLFSFCFSCIVFLLNCSNH